MKLIFHGQAIVEARSGGVNFAGQYVDPDGRSRDVICRVTREVLEVLCALQKPTTEELLGAYFQVSKQINQLAAVQFSAGIERPFITTQDIPRGWLAAREAA